MRNIRNKSLYLMTVAILTASSISAGSPSARAYKNPWNGFFVGGLLGGKIIGGKGSITTLVNSTEEKSTKNDILFPLPSYTLSLGFNSQFYDCATISFGGDFEYGVFPNLRLAYGYLATPLDRISVGVGLDALLFSFAVAGKGGLDVSSFYGLTPSVSYERSIGNGAFFQARLSYNYLGVKGDNLNNDPDYKFPEPVKRFVKDYWDKDVKSLKSVDAYAHSVTLGLGFGYTF